MAQSDRRPRRGGRQEPPGQPEELAHPSEEPGGRAGRVLTEVGWVQDVIVNKASGFVVDGHARVALAIKAGEKVKEGLKVFQSCRRRKLYTAPSGRI